MQTQRPSSTSRPKPYIFMALSICSRYCFRTQRENRKKFSKAFTAWLCLFISTSVLPAKAFAQDELPKLSILPWQLIGLDNEFPSRNKKKLESLQKQIAAAALQDTQALDLWLEGKGRSLPLNLKHSLHPVLSGSSSLATPGSAYIVPILCRVGEHVVVATELVDLSQNLLLASEQQFTPHAAWADEAAPISFNQTWIQNLASRIKGIDPDTQAYKIDFSLRRGSDTSIVGSHKCLNMLLAHELQKSLNVPTPLDLLEGYRLRQLMANSSPKKSTRTFSIDWGMHPKGLVYEADINASESVMAAHLERGMKFSFQLKPEENRLVPPPDFLQKLEGTKAELQTRDLPQVAKVYRAWVYLDRGRAWGLEMNDRLYFDDNGRRVKGHVVGFFTRTAGLKSPRGFDINEGAIVYVRKGQRDVKVGDTFQFDPTSYPTPWPAVPQPSNIPPK